MVSPSAPRMRTLLISRRVREGGFSAQAALPRSCYGAPGTTRRFGCHAPVSRGSLAPWGSPSGARAEFRRDLVARLPERALEILEVVGEAGARPRDAPGGDTLTVRVEGGGRHRREVGLALATVDGDAGAADLLKLAPEVGRPHDRRWSQAPQPSLDDLGNTLGVPLEHHLTAAGPVRRRPTPGIGLR